MEGQEYYFSPWQKTWRLKRSGGVKVIKSFPSREEALEYAQVLIAKHSARFWIQDEEGRWERV